MVDKKFALDVIPPLRNRIGNAIFGNSDRAWTGNRFQARSPRNEKIR